MTALSSPRVQRSGLGLAGVGAAIGLWWLVSAGLQSVQLPPPNEVWTALWADLHSIPGLEYVSFQTESLVGAAGWTIANVLVCCGIGAVIGYGLGLLLASSRIARDVLRPPLFVLGTTPTLVLLPFVLIWFGPSRLAQGSLVIIFTGLTVAAFTEQSTTLIGERYSQYATSLGARPATIVRHVVIPSTIPSVAGGLRVSLAMAWSLDTVAELIAGRNGVGRVIETMAQLDRTADIIAAVLLLASVAVVFDGIIVLVAKGLTPWTE